MPLKMISTFEKPYDQIFVTKQIIADTSELTNGSELHRWWQKNFDQECQKTSMMVSVFSFGELQLQYFVFGRNIVLKVNPYSSPLTVVQNNLNLWKNSKVRFIGQIWAASNRKFLLVNQGWFKDLKTKIVIYKHIK